MSNPSLQGWLLFYGRARAPRARFVAGAGFVSVGKIDDAFWPIFVRDSIGMGVDPRDLAAVMLAESGMNPRAVNVDRDPKSPTNGEPLALGLNQLFRSNWGMLKGMSPDEYLALPASAQWARIVAPFFRGVLGTHPAVRDAAPENRARDLYWINFLSDPRLYRSDSSDEAIVTDNPKFVKGNRALTINGEDVIRAGGLRAFLLKAQKDQASRWAAILAAIDATEQGIGPSLPQPRPPIPQERDPAPSGPGLGNVLAIAAAAGGVWFVWSSYSATARLKGALVG